MSFPTWSLYSSANLNSSQVKERDEMTMILLMRGRNVKEQGMMFWNVITEAAINQQIINTGVVAIMP